MYGGGGWKSEGRRRWGGGGGALEGINANGASTVVDGVKR